MNTDVNMIIACQKDETVFLLLKIDREQKKKRKNIFRILGSWTIKNLYIYKYRLSPLFFTSKECDTDIKSNSIENKRMSHKVYL